MNRKLLIVLLLLLVCSIASADATQTISSFFSKEKYDPAEALLGLVFGPVSPEINLTMPIGQPLTVIAAMFKEFNNAMLVLAMILIIYGGLFGLVTTAHEGEFLGKRNNSIWMPLRAIFSVILLIPNDQGYCILQVVLMWIILQGSGAADQIWDVAVTTLNFQGMPTLSNADDNMTKLQAEKLVQNLYQAEVCTQIYTKVQTQDPTDATKWTPAPAPQPYRPVPSDGKIYFYFTPTGMAQGTCGSLVITDPDSIQDNQKTDKGRYDTLNAVYSVLSPPGAMTDITNAAVTFVSGYPSSQVNVDLSATVNNLSTAITSGESDYTSTSPNLDDLKKAIVKMGWMYAGAFYREVADVSGTYDDAFNSGDVPLKPPITPGHDPYNNQIASAANAALNLGTDTGDQGEDVLNINTQAALAGAASGKWDAGSMMNAPVNVIGNFLVMAFLEALTGGNTSVVVDGQVIKNDTDPIYGLQAMGNRIITIVEFAWTIMLALFIAGLVVGSACAAVNPITFITMWLFHIAGWFMMLLAVLFGVGLMMSVYIPMIPYIVFFFGVIGWIIAVFESMLAAPLVAMAMADIHHEGGGVWGRASVAFMLIVGVFIRPIFMIFGLVGGMLIARIAIDLLNSAFSFVMISTSNVDFSKYFTSDVSSPFFSGGGKPLNPANLASMGIGPFQLVSFIVIYLSMVIVIVNRAFSLINVIPDQVLRWIGGHAGFGQYAEQQAGEVKSMAQAGMGQVGRAGGAVGQGMAKTGAEHQAGVREDQKKSKQQSGGGSSGGSNVSGQGGGGNTGGPSV